MYLIGCIAVFYNLMLRYFKQEEIKIGLLRQLCSLVESQWPGVILWGVLLKTKKENEKTQTPNLSEDYSWMGSKANRDGELYLSYKISNSSKAAENTYHSEHIGPAEEKLNP